MPESYGTARLALLVRAPNSIYIYWELPEHSRRDNNEKIRTNDSRYVIRMYDVTLVDFNGSNANHYFDIEIDINSKGWYVELWSDCVTYCAELGVRTNHGSFIPIVRSNYITTPRRSFSDRADMIWMNQEQKAFVSPAENIPSKEEREVVVDRKDLKADKPTVAPTPGYQRLSRSHNRLPLSVEEIKAYYAKLYPLFARIKGLLNGKSALLKNGMKLEKSAEESPDYCGSYKKYSIGSSAEMIEKVGASENIAGNNQSASEQQFINLKGRSFYFEIGAELIVYGRTEPNAIVKLGDNVIKLRADGTFTLRFALPDGKIPLDFKAISGDKVEIRAISTSVEREKTRYNP